MNDQHRYNDFTKCYFGLIKDVATDPDFDSSPRGLKVREKLAVKFTLTDPRNRLPYVNARDFSVGYLVGELLWYLSGNNSTAWIEKYSKFWKNISDDGSTANSSYGSRIFKSHPRISPPGMDDWTQWNYVKNELLSDPDSRRAVIHIRTPQDSALAKLDVPCTLTLQFLLRNNKLNLVTSMRSSDLILGIAYDVPAFTLFQEMMANELNCELGEYVHVSNSLHLYERNFQQVSNIIQESTSIWWTKPKMPRLPKDIPIEEMIVSEAEIVQATLHASLLKALDNSIKRIGDQYWRDWMIILAAHRASKLSMSAVQADLLNSTVFEGYQFFRK